jgi:hypothetical protein
MSIPDDIDGLSAWAYEQGTDPLDWAIKTVDTQIDVWMIVCAGRAQNPALFPGFHPDLSVEALARRIVGRLMDAGWRVPGSTGTPATPELLEPRE